MPTEQTRRRLAGRDREEMILQIGHLFCEKNLKLSKIADQLGISRSTVIRLFNEAIGLGYIIEQRPLFRPPQRAKLEVDLRRRFNLKDAIVVTSPGKQEMLRPILASTTVEFLEDIFARESDRKLTIGLSGGMTIEQVVEKLPEAQRNVEVYPLHFLERVPHPDYASGGLLASGFARKCKSTLYHAGLPVVTTYDTEDQWNGELKLIRQLRIFGERIAAWQSLDVAIMSVGPISRDSLTVQALEKISWGLPKLNELDIVGILDLALLKRDGSTVGDFFLSIPLQTLANLASDPKRYVILVAGGRSYDGERDKIQSIEAVLNARLVNVVVTDDITAERLLGKTGTPLAAPADTGDLDMANHNST